MHPASPPLLPPVVLVKSHGFLLSPQTLFELSKESSPFKKIKLKFQKEEKEKNLVEYLYG